MNINVKNRFGISIYPEHSTQQKDFEYMELAAKYGFTRLFTCLLSVETSAQELIEKFTTYIKKAHDLGFIVSIDTNPKVFKHLNASAFDLSVFAKMNVDILRLDTGLGDFYDVAITRNKYNIKIEFNGSSTAALDKLILDGANRNNMITCHNFYPQKYTGLSWDVFTNFTNKWNDLNLHTAAFVSTNQPNTFGPWPVYKGLVTCEMHRGLPIDLQTRHYIASHMINDIMIGNAYASELELSQLSKIDFDMTTMKIDLADNISDIEKKIIFDHDHTSRSDTSNYLLRSFMPRIYYKNESIPVREYENKFLKRGDIVIVNESNPHYKGELQLVLQDIENDGERNYVGCIKKEELIILDLLKPADYFKLII